MTTQRARISPIPAVSGRYRTGGATDPNRKFNGLSKLRFRFESDSKSLSGNYPFELLSFLSISRIEASLMNARALRVRFSKSLANRRHRLSQAKVRSTAQRLGRTSKPSAVSERLTISTADSGNSLANAARNFGPW